MQNAHVTNPNKFNIDFDKFERLAKEIQEFTRQEEGLFEQHKKSSQDDDRP